jgi:single-stranded-DNA-specific exonuclease
VKDWKVKKRVKSDLIDQILLNRGIEDRDSFFCSRYEDLADPFLAKGVKEAIPIIRKSKNITVFADYDADGVTSGAIMKSVLPNADIYIPDRKRDGYGLNKKAVREAARKSDLFITVDSGVTDVEEVKLAKSLGVKVVITDHHQIPEVLPKADAIINPHQEGCSYPFKDLCGAGVAFTLARALLKDDPNKAKWLLDLVAIGTIADMVPLVGENRIITKFGLIVLGKTKRVGLESILPEEINSEAVAFRVAPMLNAAGRMGHANTSYELLITDSEEESSRIAKELDKTNQRRRSETERVMSEILEDVELDEKLIFASNDSWPVGVIGLAAGRLMDRYHRPVVVLSGGIASCRSIEGFNIVKALTKFSGLLTEFGGHPRAAGFRVAEGNVSELKKGLLSYASETLNEEDMVAVIDIDAEISVDEVSWELVEELAKMEPFGFGNARPVFLLKNVVAENIQFVGNGSQHLKFIVKSGDQILKGIFFNAGGLGAHLKDGDKLDLVTSLESDEWNGFKSLQLKVVDLRKSE